MINFFKINRSELEILSIKCGKIGSIATTRMKDFFNSMLCVFPDIIVIGKIPEGFHSRPATQLMAHSHACQS